MRIAQGPYDDFFKSSLVHGRANDDAGYTAPSFNARVGSNHDVRPRDHEPPTGRVAPRAKDLLVNEWSDRVLADHEVPYAKRLSQPELRDHIPSFIDQLSRALDAHASRPPLTRRARSVRQEIAEGQASCVRRMARSAERASKMNSDMLDMAHTRFGGGIRLRKRLADTRAVCQGAIDEAQLRHPDRTIAFGPQGDGTDLFDPERMAQALSNLLSNAIAYSPPASTVRIGTHESDDAQLVIEVQNVGPIIPPCELETIFDPFRRGAETLRTTEGLGLGLFIARQIAVAHEGTIDVTSTASDGTLFTVTFPSHRGERVSPC